MNNLNSNKRNTIQKQLIIDTVRAMHNHPSADEIYSEIAKLAPNISRATVYRNLALLSQNGDILRIQIPNASDRFDFNVSIHYHLLCGNCGRIFDLVTAPLDIIGSVKSDNCSVDGFSLLFTGLCENCIL